MPAGVWAMADRGPDWLAWVRGLPVLVADLMAQWRLCVDGTVTHGHCSMVLPVRTAEDVPAMPKIGFPEPESEHEHLALRRWNGDGAVRLLSADPHRRALLLERLRPVDLSACPGPGGLPDRRRTVPADPRSGASSGAPAVLLR